MSYHSENRVWGTAQNPYNKLRTCGGSSGGDAALVATRCVPLAIGTDIGGSIRIPSDFNGVYGFKGSSNRLTQIGGHNVMKNLFSSLTAPGGRLRGTIGPIASNVDDLITIMKIFLHPESHRYDPFAPPMPFRQEVFDKALSGKIRIGYLE